MEQKRAQTSEALENFIQSQRVVLERTHADIERLRELRREVEGSTSLDPEQLYAKLHDPAFRLSDQADAMPPLPPGIDWDALKGADPAPFRTMAAAAREAYAARNVPPTTQVIAPSALQEFVASQRRALVDPVLHAFRLPDDLAALSSDDEEPPDAEELRRLRERDKIRELKKRRIEGETGASVYGLAGLGLRRPSAVMGVYIRRDQEDESAEVDIAMGDAEEGVHSMGGSEASRMEVDTPATSVASPLWKEVPAVSAKTGKRERRPTRKAQARMDAKATAIVKKKSGPNPKVQPTPKPEPEGEEDPEDVTEPPRGTRRGKVKSETYKQAWTVSEQHLLERLLEEIPEGESQRWSKISKAMDGRRTPRQVASRVQKYFEKLKRFGIEVGHAGASCPNSTV